MVTQTAYDANGATLVPEATKYLYASPIDPSLQTIVIAPDSTDAVSLGGNGDWTITTGTDHTTTTYNLQGEPLTSTDPRVVTHTYSYDSAGRVTLDSATIPSGVANSVLSIGTSYDDLGRALTVTSYSASNGGGTTVNQVQNAYDGWSNLAQQWQSASGQVAIGTTPSVQYVYQDGASGNVAQFVRLANVIYPNGRKLDYNYTNAVDQIMSRLSNITDDSPTQQLAAYTYLGADAIASETFPQPGISLDYSANNFAALDRFGRVQDQAWKQSGTSRDEYTYLYNAAGDRTSRSNALTYLLNEGYTYDALHRLTQWAVNNSPQESWSLDALGNMLSNKGTAEQFDPANEITSINGSASLSGYDLAGNMTTTPQPGNASAAYTCTFDAWNRLATVTNGGTTNVTYSYDGTGRLVVTAVSGGATTYSYYDGQNAIETRVNGTGASSVQYQYVYSPLGAGKTPILRDDFTGGGAYPRLYYLDDANTNVTAVVGYNGSAWQVAERYVYDPYGTVTYYSANWTSSPSPLLTHANTVLYASMVLDQTTGLYYDEARWYSTAISTFLTTDPARADVNTYRYCGNGPTIYVDPSGLLTVNTVANRVALLASANISKSADPGQELYDGDVAFDIDCIWQVNNSAFPATGKTPQQIGIIQIIKIDSPNYFSAALAGTWGQWTIDSKKGTGFYSTGTTGAPASGDPTTLPRIGFHDSPYMYTYRPLFYPRSVNYDFETYVVGRTGPEGMAYEGDVFAKNLTAITVYGGVGWGAKFTAVGCGRYHRDTYLNRDIAPTGEFKGLVESWFRTDAALLRALFLS